MRVVRDTIGLNGEGVWNNGKPVIWKDELSDLCFVYVEHNGGEVKF